MLTIVCGEDTVKARDFYRSLIDSEREKNNEIVFVPSGQIREVINPTASPFTLFGDRQVYATENLNKLLGRATKNDLSNFLKIVAGSKEVYLITFEQGVTARELKVKNIGTVKEFKPSENIFKLLDSIYPNNLRQFVGLLDSLSGAAEGFILIMLMRHIRKLVLIKEGAGVPGLAPWQATKLKSQAARWGSRELISFYDALLRIDIGGRAGKSPFKTREGLQIAACYFM